MKIQLPELSLVVLIGPSGSGKSSFAKKHFRPTEVISSDYCRGLVSDDENDQSVTADAFDVLNFIAAKRLRAGKLTVVDATNVQREARAPLVKLARENDVLPTAIVLNLPAKLCHARNQGRPDRNFDPYVTRRQALQLRTSIRGLKREGFRHITILDSPEKIENIEVERVPLWNNQRSERGPFDIIGDVHGCFDELTHLLDKLGYQTDVNCGFLHPEGRRVVFVGDLVDRGPKSPEVLRLVMMMVKAGTAFCIPGNHEQKLKKKLIGKDVRLTHGLAETMDQLSKEPESFHKEVMNFIDSLVSHLVFDNGKLVVAHAGLKEAYHGRASRRVREFALYGETMGETDEFGLPIRYDWAADYRGAAMVVYGHTPVPTADWLNNTICIDTGCVFGGSLTALRYPERELVDVEAQQIYYESTQPQIDPSKRDKRSHNDVLDIKDVVGKRIVQTRFRGLVTIPDENSTAALEVMSRFAVDPRWLIYLPPTMSPTDTRKSGDVLEHPQETFDYFRTNGVARVICEEKHMGSRAVIVICRDEEAAERRFGIHGDGIGSIYTRTGRPFFNRPALETELLQRIALAMTKTGQWEKYQTDWFCLDAELMPWSAKAQELLRTQYAPVGASGRYALRLVVDKLQKAKARGADVGALLDRYEARKQCLESYTEAYRRYCWPVEDLRGIKLAPFHLLASEGRVHIDKDHVWHMTRLAELCAGDEDLFLETKFKVVELLDSDHLKKGIDWWEELTAAGGEGMVVKPLEWLVRGTKGLIQPAVKCRGREYLRIIYGPEYTLPEHLERLRGRSLGPKRSLALREFALGLEGLYRFIEKEPLYRVHECAFGVLALETQPVDPRL